MRNIVIDELKRTPIDEQRIEIVERKGIGHPDTICDGIMNEVSIALSKEYIKRFGAVMHHNIDKSLLVAGEVERRFGGGIVKVPMLLVFGDRATYEVGNVSVPVKEIAIETAKKWIRENLRFVDPEKHMKYQVELKRGSAELTDIFKRKGKILGANDTSAAVGYAPMTKTERIVLETERYLNSKKFKKEFPMSGEDIKVMGYRKNSDLNMTICMAFVDKFIDSEETYFKKKKEILEVINAFVKEKTDFKRISISLNTLDKKGRGMGGMYLTVLGTSADDADCGQVGRGNRVNGIIPLNRPVSSEAAAGKNPVSHVGKVYNVLTYKMADRIYKEVPGIREVYVWLLSQIGKPIDQPTIAATQIVMKKNKTIDGISKQVKKIIDDELAHINDFCNELINGRISIF
ncbi:MAG: methionine adenosyltransferase [Candidatus Parvarchaeota archaeon]|nr:methionine adenosyltransferase [Candidatus Jingweiarchaeum tengchongense]MCW1298399.1 methionine adenosyltransferase [Candidatus Jingweiarchaeum tengchongense]MCW1300299.1 methionine adenosyltransferase [Candidatus Jingweiarchaeum tengchongense]MCW1304905.1 methionine adenosyltransferase [Candidatus Jingweiarchaeum tengchongense]MCW1305795.1 methionine adenosyltransferase [Candidatus Jingweiarchaeum tengchongense]